MSDKKTAFRFINGVITEVELTGNERWTLVAQIPISKESYEKSPLPKSSEFFEVKEK